MSYSYIDIEKKRRAGKIGGSKKTTKPKGFAAVPGLASRAGKIGGKATKKQYNATLDV